MKYKNQIIENIHHFVLLKKKRNSLVQIVLIVENFHQEKNKLT
jgi:hypothetical protein